MKKKIKSNIYRNPFFDNPLFITGLTRSGKTMFAPIISSLDKVEKVNVNFQFEYIPMLNIINSISDKAASTTMRYFLDNQVYDNMIGRNMNLRLTDWTSIWNNSDPMKYLSRLSVNEDESILENINKSNQIFSLLVHDALWHIDKYYNAFDNLKMIHIDRHPVDLIFSWFIKGYGSDYYSDPRNDLLTIVWKDKILPYYAYGWEEEYISLNEMSRIIKMVDILQKKGLEAYDLLSAEKKERIFFVRFEEFVLKPESYIDNLCCFLNTKLSPSTPIVMKKERVPRLFSEDDRKAKMAKIKKSADKKTYEILIKMIDQYEKVANSN